MTTKTTYSGAWKEKKKKKSKKNYIIFSCIYQILKLELDLIIEKRALLVEHVFLHYQNLSHSFFKATK